MENTITEKLQAIRRQYPEDTDIMDDEDLLLFCLRFFLDNAEMVQEMEEESIWNY